MAGNKKIKAIEIMRIIAALGVFTGHFLGIGIASEYSLKVLRFMRDSGMGKSILAYTYEGDISVIFFYVVGGFFITYNFYTRKNDNKKIQHDFLRKIYEIVVPSIVIVLITAFLSYLCYRIGVSNQFSMQELKLDIIRILLGGVEDNMPYYAYHLWYIHKMVVGYLYAYAFLGLTSESIKFRYLVYIPMLYYFIVSDSSLPFIFLGVASGDVCAHIMEKRKFYKNSEKLILIILVFIATMAGPMIYNEHQLGTIHKLCLSGCMAIIIVALVLLHNSNDEKDGSDSVINKGIDWLNDINFSFYCVHAAILYAIGIAYHKVLNVWKWEEGILLLFAYITALACSVVCAGIFKKMIIKNAMRLFKWCEGIFG